MPEVVARIAFEYAGRHVEPGQRVEMPVEHVRLLVAIGRVEDPAQPAKPAAPAVGTYRTRDIAVAPVAKDAPKKTRNRVKILGANA